MRYIFGGQTIIDTEISLYVKIRAGKFNIRNEQAIFKTSKKRAYNIQVDKHPAEVKMTTIYILFQSPT